MSSSKSIDKAEVSTELISLYISEHSALQEMANHYNGINWTIHSIFIPMHGVFLSILVNVFWSSQTLYSKEYLVGCCVGFIFVLTWFIIYYRHRNMIMRFYNKLHVIEHTINDLSGCNYFVHLSVEKMDKEKKKIDRIMNRILRTHNIIIFLQIILAILYILLAVKCIANNI